MAPLAPRDGPMSDTPPLTGPDLRRRWAKPAALRAAAYAVVVVCGGWWLLGQLAAVLRPLLLAVFLSYILLPYYARLRRRLPAPVAVALLAGLTMAAFAGLGVAVYNGLAGLTREEPELRAKAVDLIRRGTAWVQQYVPGVLGSPAGGRPPEEFAVERLTGTALQLLNVATLAVVEAATAGLYLVFLLLESSRFPARVRAAYPPHRADEILAVFGRINAAIVSYLRAKVTTSLLLAGPVGIVLTACGVRFAGLWAVLTFVCNFIPYVGTLVAYALPVGFTLLQFGPGATAVVVAVLVLACHLGTATVAEPLLIGKAVGLSPLVILAALAMWGALWNLPGLFLAVPLTVVLVLVLENIPMTRSLAKLLTG